MRRVVVPIACFMILAACNQQQPAAPTPAATPAPVATPVVPAKLIEPTRDGHFSPDITAEDFAALVQRFASDEFEGRKPGTIGERSTTTYLIDQFQRMGLKPAFKDSYLQRVPMVEVAVVEGDKVALDVAEGGNVEKFNYRTDTIVMSPQGRAETQVTDSDVVFAGYGVVAPEYQWNDFAGLDVKGKTVVVLINDPGWGNHDANLFKGDAMTYYGRWTYKFEEAARQGAAACLIVHDTAAAAYPWDVVVNSWSGPQFYLPASEDADPRVPLGGWITTDAARRLFAKAGADFDALKKSADVRGFKPTALAAKLSTRLSSQIRNTSSDNVVALLPGGERPEEAVAYSAHWDHFGKNPDIKGDNVFHGAVDNGTGLAALLELADAFAHQQPRPKRSLLFIAPTLEESGLLGSRYYAMHPAIAMSKTVAAINMDMFIPVGRTHDLSVIGYGESQMDDYLKDALTPGGRTISPDGESAKGYFYRSDQINFAHQGVPVLYVHSGLDKLDGGRSAGLAASEDYTRNRYHKPADRFETNWDLSGVIEDVQALHAVGQRLADESTFPQWAADSEFRAAREAAPKKTGSKSDKP
jgi:Zn-dependent M28 family amino/carboxypeptidase